MLDDSKNDNNNNNRFVFYEIGIIIYINLYNIFIFDIIILLLYKILFFKKKKILYKKYIYRNLKILV